MDTIAARFPAYAALTDDQLLELIEETGIARAESARGAHERATFRMDTVAMRLGIAEEIEPLAAYLVGENGDLS
jgi:hypothetical protein